MVIIESDDLRIANKMGLYTPPIEQVMPIIDNNITHIGHLLQHNNSELLRSSYDYAKHYNSQEVLNQIEEITNQSATVDISRFQFDGDIRAIPDYFKEVIIHHPLLYDAIQEQYIRGYGYQFSEPLEETAIFNNLYGNLATEDREPFLFVDSSDHEFTNSELLNINDAIDEAMRRINEDDDITDERFI